MNPVEKFNQDVWWILQEIRNDEFLTPKGAKVDFSVRTLPKLSKKADDAVPSADTQRKLLYKLKEWTAIDLEIKSDILSGDDFLSPATRFALTIQQPKFDELYNSYDRSINYQPPKPQSKKDEKPIIRLKTLELIAKDIGNLDSGSNLVDFLANCGVDRKLIEYPQTKWRMIYDVLSGLATSGSAEDKKMLFKIIGSSVHPLTHKGNKASAEALREKFNDYLSYDKLGIYYDEDEAIYAVARIASKDFEDQILFESQMELEEKEKKQLEFFCKPDNKEKISLLRKAYQALINVVYAFCENPAHPTMELNESYQFLYKLINTTINELGLRQVETTPFSRNQHFFHLSFSNLFSAEKVYREQGRELSWQRIRPEMNAMYGDIEELYQEVSGSDVLAEPDKQKKLNEIQLHLSTLKKKREMAKKMQTKIRQTSTTNTKIEITKLPPLQFTNPSENKLTNRTKTTATLPIKDARLDEKNYLLEINNGEKIISFKSKKKGKGLEKETKQFKILYHLWDFRWELKDGRVLKKGDFTLLENLVRGSGSESTEAAYKHIQRLNNRFRNEGVAIEIKGENKKYRLIINKA